MGETLRAHRAGQPVSVKDRDALFRRKTDRVVIKEIGKRPLDVGADRIARTAHAALALLERLREITGQPIPLAWTHSLQGGLHAIEVYPAATLKVYELPSSRYKAKNQGEKRKEILCSLEKNHLMKFDADTGPMIANADTLDAVICLLAAADFLCDPDALIQPPDESLAQKEGWIWVRRPRL
jgi:hypothetical protein